MVHRVCYRSDLFEKLSSGESLPVESLVITAADLGIMREDRPPCTTRTRTGVEPTTSSGLYVDATLLIKPIISWVPILFFEVSVRRGFANLGKASWGGSPGT